MTVRSCMQVHVRVAYADDLAHLVDIDRSVGAPVDLEVLCDQISTRRILVAEHEGDVAGYLAHGFMWEHLPFMQMLRVHPDHRRNGVASSLIEELCRRLADDDQSLVLSSCDHNNVTSAHMHIELGFLPCGYIDFGERDAGELFFRRDLASLPS